MSKRKNILSPLLLLILIFGSTGSAWPQLSSDSVFPNRPTFIHRLEIESRPGYILPTNRFLRGENAQYRPIKHSFSTHLKYAFQFHPDSRNGQIYQGAYQGIGLAYSNFENSWEIGDPKAIYLFQGATLADISRRLSFDYEWNFGISSGWNPYDYYRNPFNGMVGSEINAYMNVNFYIRHLISRRFDIIYGITLSHFSNGNTKFPNAGLNTTDIKVGLTYNINRQENYLSQGFTDRSSLTSDFSRYVNYDVVLFGSWRRKGVLVRDTPVASPDKYNVLGFCINPMYNLGYKLRIGASLDGVYDSSANIYPADYITDGSHYTENVFLRPPIQNQLALGISARAEYVMPYFDVGLGIGTNVLHRGKDLKGLYQILALKIKVTRHTFIHIGYNLQNFDTPNYLMLGVGVRLSRL